MRNLYKFKLPALQFRSFCNHCNDFLQCYHGTLLFKKCISNLLSGGEIRNCNQCHERDDPKKEAEQKPIIATTIFFSRDISTKSGEDKRLSDYDQDDYYRESFRLKRKLSFVI